MDWNDLKYVKQDVPLYDNKLNIYYIQLDQLYFRIENNPWFNIIEYLKCIFSVNCDISL